MKEYEKTGIETMEMVLFNIYADIINAGEYFTANCLES